MTETERLNDFSKFISSVGIEIPFMDWLIREGFFCAPASTKYHGNYSGGLYDHSKAVAEALMNLTSGMNLCWERPESPVIVGMFHDLCKIDNYKEIVDEEGEIFFGTDEAHGREVHFEYAHPLIEGHGEKSIMLLSRFITLTEEEMHCIRFHMGAYIPTDIDAYGKAIQRYHNVLFTHTADMIASKIKGV